MASRPGSRSKTRATLKELTSLTKNLAKAMTSQLNCQQEPDLVGEVLKKVASSNPPVYDGKEDPASIENWIREFDKLFTAVRCDDELKINNATYYLREEADLWWSQRKESLATQEDFGWEQFKEALRTKFYPPHLRKKKCLEFTNLRMGTMTVNEYYSKFIELMRFAPEMVPTEVLKAQRFEQGLTLSIQGKLGGANFNTLGSVGRAAHLLGSRKRVGSEPGDKRKGLVMGSRWR
ncbi:uncharacterized protein LOC104882935 [Beta vulgaris subsp. vulgaris]|uniref:uncharacterized protein LOC104882935 n=1 Tax=Beta vulgaris subsp. vulgaris TaxID=3555 RepID=UPI00254729FF|nr:uncharacterized protein LOC104882935 [Beta vulgaris subsp. vulgaris]